MGARSRVCPACGRGSLFGLLGQLAVLGVLLLAIGVVSGIVPLAPIERAVTGAPADTARVARPAHPARSRAARRPRSARREPPKAESVAAVPPLDSPPSQAVVRILAAAPCSAPDTEMIRTLLAQTGALDESRIAARACGQAADQAEDSGRVTVPQPAPPAPDSVTGWPADPADSPTAEPRAF